MASDDQQEGDGRALTMHRLDRDFSLVLVKTIEAIKHDPAQFRNLIYEMARVQLQREAWHRNPPMNILELRRMMLALETAIERVETEAAQRDAIPALAPGGLTAVIEEVVARDAIGLIDQAPGYLRPDRPATVAKPRTMRVPRSLTAVMRLGVLAVAAAAGVIFLDREFHLVDPTPPPSVEPVPVAQAATAASIQQPPAPSVPSVPSVPVPSVYGVYALSDGKLFELEPLVGHAPDPRVIMSAMIKTPSHTVLPNGQVSFVVYRRDIASSAPDRVTVRVIAKIARAVTFTKTGQPVTGNIDDAWAIRNVSFDYRVAPAAESSEMILIKPESAAPALAAGRYALIIKGQAFDFTVDGPITQTAHCLERIQAANGTFYSECRSL